LKRWKGGLLAVILLLLIMLHTTSSYTTDNSLWGSLKVGDEASWNYYWNEADSSIVKIKVMELQGYFIKFRKSVENTSTVYELNLTHVVGREILLPFIIPAANLHDSPTMPYRFESEWYMATYFSHATVGDGKEEIWRDYDTGILFEHRVTMRNGVIFSDYKLQSTNANLSQIDCGRKILILLISLIIITSSLIVYRRMKRRY